MHTASLFWKCKAHKGQIHPHSHRITKVKLQVQQELRLTSTLRHQVTGISNLGWKQTAERLSCLPGPFS